MIERRGKTDLWTPRELRINGGEIVKGQSPILPWETNAYSSHVFIHLEYGCTKQTSFGFMIPPHAVVPLP
jgi:hypothetical protein